MQTIKKFLRLVARYVLGGTFVFSGFVKAVDPLGSAYKFQDYFTAFGMPWLSGLALFLAIALSWAELTLGVLMVLDVLRPVAVWGIAGFMAVFTPLTLYLAIANPVSDCGCFGDAVKLTNWETFAKNVVLVLFVVLLMLGGWKNRLYIAKRRRWLQIAGWALIGVLALSPSLHALRHLPFIDFRPYRVGASFVEGRRVPDGAPVDEYRTTFLYSKNGETKEFTEENYPWDDTTWQFVDSKSELIAKGYTPPMGSFRLADVSGADVTDSIVLGDNYTALGVSTFLEKVSAKDAERWLRLSEMVRKRGGKAVLATSSGPEAIESFLAKYGGISIVTADERVLKTVVRANPGVVLLQHGVVLNKWRMRDVPFDSLAEGDLLSKCLRTQAHRMERAAGWVIVVSLLVIRLALLEYRRREKWLLPQGQSGERPKAEEK